MNDLFGSESLNYLATRINEEHAEVEASLKAGLIHAKTAGDLLIKAKGKLSHGQWLSWLAAHCRVTDRMARNYMRIASQWEELSNRQRVSDLSLRDALQLLSHSPEDQPKAPAVSALEAGQRPYTPFLASSKEDRHYLVSTWWDQQARYTILLSAIGWSTEHIAECMSITVREVELILCPMPPPRSAADIGQDLAETYATTVQCIIASILASCYRTASYATNCEDEFESVRQEMQTLSNFHARQARQLWPRDIILTDSEDSCALWCCALSDSRAALGIEEPREFGPMLESFRAVLERQRMSA